MGLLGGSTSSAEHWEHWSAGEGPCSSAHPGAVARSGGGGAEGAPLRPCARTYKGFLKARSWQRGSAGSMTRDGESIGDVLQGGGAGALRGGGNTTWPCLGVVGGPPLSPTLNQHRSYLGKEDPRLLETIMSMLLSAVG